VKQTPQCFNGVGADMALEQIINRSQKSKKKSFTYHWKH